MSDVAVLVPVLDRPHRIEPLVRSVAAATYVSHRILFGASDQPSIDEIRRLGCEVVVDEGGDEGSYAKRINRLYRASTEPYVLLAADDLAFRPGWFEAARRVADEVDGVAAINDLYSVVGVHFLIKRSYIETMSGCVDEPNVVLHEGYRHAYCDDELRWTATARGRFGYAPDSVIEHLHPGIGKSQSDHVYRIGAESMTQGAEVFRSRAHLWTNGV